MCGHHTSLAVIVVPAVLGGLALKLAIIGGLVGWLRHHEHKERRTLANLEQSAKTHIEEKTVIIENRGPQGGAVGVAEVITTGPAGTAVTTSPTVAGGAVIVSTTTAGIPGGVVKVEPGKTAIVKAEHPVGKPEEAKIVSTTHQ
ncbi:hypothetical protein BDZ85DRAFT_278532 [Elsinoe ampelina]|uniref:Uncharacterized protein n=1 Tax=Elsinoe ampelina TaxID=302913 RepID=A0A6A6GM38_9PEZI|nr:hypothetical protein BDZ85DRAFT_278532 [Elsinoe ampelina]